jgi:D-alanyl-lipoteichoic acid acyltransferase DltB (MBOAT superfamily)
MLFNSFDFFIFFPVVTLLFFLTPQKYKWLLLLLASCYFYMQFIPYYMLILGAMILIDYFAGIWIASAVDKKQKKLFLIISIASNLGLLFIFKYYNFFIHYFKEAFPNEQLLPYFNLILPIGLSFHTLQAMSYTIEVYRGNCEAERHPGKYALYVMFYPQLVAGPIERPQHLLPQWNEPKELNYANLANGLKMMLWGFFKKLVIADRIAVIVNTVYGNPAEYDSLSILFATYLFAFQIYCDFSGYSDIAIGAAKVMGYELVENFRVPYLSSSVREFWTRWHISLSRWLKDYIYIPLGGNRVRKWRWYYNVLLVFLLSGLWHGANTTFLIWGLLHGIYLIISMIMAQGRVPSKKLFAKAGRIIVTFHLVAFAWIFFRASSLKHAAIILHQLTTFSNYAFRNMRILNDIRIEFIYTTCTVLLIFLFIDPFMDALIKGRRQISTVAAHIVFALVLTTILLTGYFGKIEFIYFKF